ncbi:unnamed protein product [Orchesella dallaii]|uniref:Glycoside hydrolase family 19 catalytic domain-containing protein n=1 Tax=Orchesella dallaii TaxID=48710 RepID=A0ABP1RHN8_9HEXA
MIVTTISLLLFAGVAVSSIKSKNAQDCWTTGCQPNDWAVKGCSQYDRVERCRERCWDSRGVEGNKYTCCARGGGGGPGPGDGGSGTGFVNYNQFSQAVTSNGYPAPSQEQYNNFNNYARQQGKISTTQEAAMALAQLLHESDGLRAKREYACAQSNCPDSYRYPGCDAPNQYYYGRGYIQLSWCYNYRDASASIFGDNRLVTDADQVARDDRIAWQTAFWFWGDRVHDKAGVQQGQFGATTKAINGGIECSSPGHAQAQARFRLYGNVRKAFGLHGAGDPSGCA